MFDFFVSFKFPDEKSILANKNCQINGNTYMWTITLLMNGISTLSSLSRAVL